MSPIVTRYISSLILTLSILTSLIPSVSAFDAHAAFEYVDSSCHSKIGKVNDAGEDYTAMLHAALEGAEAQGKDPSKLRRETFRTYWGALGFFLVRNGYKNMQKIFTHEGKKLSLYCDGDAFEFTNKYLEDDPHGKYQKGDRINPKNKLWGAWVLKSGRSAHGDADPRLYILGEFRMGYCYDPLQGGTIFGASQPGGSMIILCPAVFDLPSKVLTSVHPWGTSLDKLISISSVLLHEISHAALSTRDDPNNYKVNGAIFVASKNRARNNAENWEYYSIAEHAKKNAWVMGFAQDVDDFGPDAKEHGEPTLTAPGPIARQIRRLKRHEHHSSTPFPAEAIFLPEQIYPVSPAGHGPPTATVEAILQTELAELEKDGKKKHKSEEHTSTKKAT